MLPRERMLTVLAHSGPDRVPTGEIGVDYPVVESILGRETFYRAKLKEKVALWEGRRDEIVASQKRDLVELAQKLEWDFVPVFLTYSGQRVYVRPRFLDENTWEDEFGNVWKYSPLTEDYLCVKYRKVGETELAELEQRFSPEDSELELVRHVVTELGKSHFIVARGSKELGDTFPVGRGITDGTFPAPGEGLNMPIEDFIFLLVDQPDFAKKLLAACTQRAIEVGKVLIREGADAIVLGADYCYNSGPWISPTQFAEFVFPLLKREVDAFHEEGAYVIKHTDGYTWPILDLMVEAGIDGLHGIQPSIGMDVGKLKKRYGKRLTLFGAVEGDILIRGSSQEVAKAVEYCLRYGTPGGGFVLTSSNSIQLGTPYQNYLSMLTILREKGVYPISL